jgi:hypothetical protein
MANPITLSASTIPSIETAIRQTVRLAAASFVAELEECRRLSADSNEYALRDYTQEHARFFRNLEQAANDLGLPYLAHECAGMAARWEEL